MSLRTNTPLKLIEKIVAHQFSSAHNAMKNNDSIEFSGLGKFLFNTKKAGRKLEMYRRKIKYYNTIIEDAPSDLKVKNAQTALNTMQENVEYLLSKLNK